MLDIWQFMLSSASMSFPRYTSPVLVSQVTMWPSASCKTLIGTPIDILAGVFRFSASPHRLPFGPGTNVTRRRREAREWRARGTQNTTRSQDTARRAPPLPFPSGESALTYASSLTPPARKTTALALSFRPWRGPGGPPEASVLEPQKEHGDPPPTYKVLQGRIGRELGWSPKIAVVPQEVRLGLGI